MVLLIAKYGNHYNPVAFRTDADVKRWFARNGIDFQRLVETCRDFNQSVPHFENLLGSTWTASKGVKLSKVDLETGAEEFGVEGPGTYTPLGYWASFEIAQKALGRAVQEISYSELQSAFVHGTASIEAYVNYRAERWNSRNPQQKLHDSRESKVRFDQKINDWIPVMSNGRKLNKSGVHWSDFLKVKALRDNVTIHPKASGYGTSYGDLAEKINLFRTGVAGLLVDLHLHFNEKIPSAIIRARYAPDVEVVSSE